MALLNAVMVNFTIAGVVADSLVTEVTGVAASIVWSGALLVCAAGALSLRYGRHPEAHSGHR
ncbi:hypothetical protein [Nonomuraea recticatena]|uniref:MFS transporter n=1 Tax=Nonomuraea recticatena TaxID=46178 RepID=A0ABP6DMZ3_9ACTN